MPLLVTFICTPAWFASIFRTMPSERPAAVSGLARDLPVAGAASVRGACTRSSKTSREKGSFDRRKPQSGELLRRVYRATPLGRNALAAGKGKIQELFGELDPR